MQVGSQVKRPCLDCPRIGEWKRGRCDQHERARDKARGPRAHGNADATHKRTRAAYQRRINAGETLHCWRCHKAIDPTDWHLGHDGVDRVSAAPALEGFAVVHAALVGAA